MQSSKGQLATKKNRRSVLKSARSDLNDVDEMNNYQLAETLARTKVRLGRTEQEKFKYVSQNLKFLETITFLKEENKNLRTSLASTREQQKNQINCITNLQAELHEIRDTLENQRLSSAKMFDRTIEKVANAVKLCGDVTESDMLHSRSLQSSFDSGLNSSSGSSSSNPDPPTTLLLETDTGLSQASISSPGNPEVFSPAMEITEETEMIEAGWYTTPKIVKSQERQIQSKRGFNLLDKVGDIDTVTVDVVMETPQINSKKAEFTNKRQTPSRSSKTAIKSFAEPSLGGKLRQGDKHTDNFSLGYIKKKKQ